MLQGPPCPFGTLVGGRERLYGFLAPRSSADAERVAGSIGAHKVSPEAGRRLWERRTLRPHVLALLGKSPASGGDAMLFDFGALALSSLGQLTQVDSRQPLRDLGYLL